MVLRRGKSFEFSPRPHLGRLLAGFLLVGLSVLPAEAALLPAGFFDVKASPGKGAAAVEADRLSYDARTDLVSAEGSVVMTYKGYTIRADHVDYDQKTGAVKAIGHVVMHDPQGSVYHAESVEVTGGMKEAFLNSMTLETPEGALIMARDVHYTAALETVLSAATYSPCGLCIDSKGRRIGWQVKSARMVYNRDRASLTMEQPSLELLGVPVAWLPWFWMPDPSQPRAQGFRLLQADFDPDLGVTVTAPYFIPVGEDIDVVLSPQLLSRQGALMGGQVNWRLPGYGEVEIKASGLYQLDRSAFAGTVGDRDWRGAIQTSGKFTPAKSWTVGWSYSAFSDNAYLRDYNFTDDHSSVSQAYGTYLNELTYFDIRAQRFNRLGNHTEADDREQGITLPVIRAEHIQDLQPGWGRLHFTGKVLSVYRADDQTRSYNGVPFVFGYEGAKQHLELEGAWENQYILPGGVAATPYLGMRLDAANYDGASGIPGAPAASMLLTATPIAAVDFRWPLMARNGLDTHLLEPVAQLVYRGSDTTNVGITNDDAQSFIFDTANLFSYNRFSGIDRQETGLRANVGAHYVGNFADGSWIDMLMGQSFHLAGVNALGIADAAQAGNDTGLEDTASYFVASARGGWANGISAGSKIQIDPDGPRITRAGVGGKYTAPNGFTTSADYMFVAKSPSRGTLDDEHQIGAGVGIPVADYWTVDGGITYDLGAWDWTKASAGVTYDDNYLLFGAGADFTPTSWGVGVKFKLKGPGGQDAF
jgi:LPS-assembly protein